MRDDAAVGDQCLGGTVDAYDFVALVEDDPVLDIPAVAMDDDFLVLLLAGEHGREHDAVVIDARLGVKDRDLVAAARVLEEMLEHAPRGHAVADDDEFLGHGTLAASAASNGFGCA